jgi:peptide/nickel transport system permease protein
MLVGVAQAARRGTWFDRIASATLLTFYSLPDFWGALMILLLFSAWIPLFPSGNMVDTMYDYMSSSQQVVDRLKHLVLPVVALTLLTTASIARYQRTAMLEVLPSDFIRTARAKGVPERRILWHHAFRTALTPMVTLAGLYLPALLGGALFVEKVFNWPGMGLVAASAITTHDYDLVTATVIVGAVLVVIGNLVADLLHVAIDPRIRD